MKIINYFSTAAIPVIIAIIILYGVIERKKVYDKYVDDVNSITGFQN